MIAIYSYSLSYGRESPTKIWESERVLLGLNSFVRCFPHLMEGNIRYPFQICVVQKLNLEGDAVLALSVPCCTLRYYIILLGSVSVQVWMEEYD